MAQNFLFIQKVDRQRGTQSPRNLTKLQMKDAIR